MRAGTPEIAGRDGYIGSAACGHCHGDKFAGWSQTPHSFAARTWDRAGLTGAAFVDDADGNGVPPTGGIVIINNLSAGAAPLDGPLQDAISFSPSTGRQDYNLDGALCQRGLWTGSDVAEYFGARLKWLVAGALAGTLVAVLR